MWSSYLVDSQLPQSGSTKEPGGYARRNDYWTAYGVLDLVDNCDPGTRTAFLARVEDIKNRYAAMSDVYQSIKSEAINIPLK